MATTQHQAAPAPQRYTSVAAREVEAIVGGVLMKTVGRFAGEMTLKMSKLVAKSVYLPLSGVTMHYHEREAIDATTGENQPTLLFFHGISQKSDDFAKLVVDLKIPTNARILIPTQIGHGKDIKRAKADPQNFKQPTHGTMLESTSEFLDVVKAGSNCNAFGVSLGGAVGYFVANKRPDRIRRSVLVSPAIPACVDTALVQGIRDGSNNFINFESREDVKLLMRDLSTGRNEARKKKDPVPKFFLETIYRGSKTNGVPDGHYKAMLESLLQGVDTLEPNANKDSATNEEQHNPFLALSDIDPDNNRLVIWPEKDRIINYEQGKRYFGVTTNEEGNLVASGKNTRFETVENCGHVFNGDGKSIFDLILPQVKEYLLDFAPVHG